MSKHPSWGLYPKITQQNFCELDNRYALLSSCSSPSNSALIKESILPRGVGRSYGDSCLNETGTLIGSGRLNHYISFDKEAGIIRCEAGVLFGDILQLVVPQGWFLPVTPGTKFVTVGGAIANDVHGKNHHVAGNFGHHVLSFEILRSSGERLHCSRSENTELFYATIGGLGLTGFITWAEFKLCKISSAWIEQEQIQFQSLSDFFKIATDSEKDYDFTVAWVDCVNKANDIRGIFIRGNFAPAQKVENFKIHNSQSANSVPFYFPEWTLNSFSIRVFNELYYRKNLTSFKKNIVHYDPFFYPLDSIHHWNKIYGRRGFLQYQFVVPFKEDSGKAISQIFDILKQSQMGSFLAVLKTFGSMKSEGMLSFPQEGVTLALDFPNYGKKLLTVLEQCDAIVKEAKGAIYPAKDARMGAHNFAAFFPRLNEFDKYIDPQFSSSFWRRVR
ncbi:MAG: FAD-binding oxidoreductase [Bdellovibrio sp.]